MATHVANSEADWVRFEDRQNWVVFGMTGYWEELIVGMVFVPYEIKMGICPAKGNNVALEIKLKHGCGVFHLTCCKFLVLKSLQRSRSRC